jgi:hypothetical protein
MALRCRSTKRDNDCLVYFSGNREAGVGKFCQGKTQKIFSNTTKSEQGQKLRFTILRPGPFLNWRMLTFVTLNKMKKISAPIIALYCIPLAISLCYGFQYRFANAGLESYFRVWSLLFLLPLAGLTYFAVKSRDTIDGTIPAWLGVALSSLSLAMTAYFYLSKVASAPVWLSYVVFSTLLSFGLARWSPRAGIYFISAAGFILNLILIMKVPHTNGANMLEIIEAASRDFIGGSNPYHMYAGIAEEPFGYLPGLWLPYSVFVLLGLDTRLFNVIAIALIAWLFERGLRLAPGKRDVILGATLYPFLLSPPVSQMLVHGHVWPYWLLLSIMAVLLVKERYLVAAIVFGLALASRQPALWIVPPLFGYLASRLGWMATLRLALIALATYATLILPFAFSKGAEFWRITYLGVANFSTIQPHISASVWLSSIGMDGLLKPAQAAVLMAAMFWLYHRKADLPAFLLVTGIAYIWTVYFNNYAVRYVYLPGLLLLTAGMTMRLGAHEKAI